MNNQNPDSILSLLCRLKESDIPSTDYSRYVSRFLENKARKTGIPLHGFFELTPLCNLSCKMCYIHLDKEQFYGKQLLPTQTWINLMQQAHTMGMLRATLTGGECLTHPGFDEIYLYLYNNGIYTRILSNGLLMTQDRVGFLKRYRPSLVQISLYGSSDDEYEAVTGFRAFSQVIHNLNLLKEAALPVTLTLTPNSFMKHDFRTLLGTVESLGIPYQINSALLTPRNSTNREKYDISDEKYIELYRIQSELKHINLNPLDPSELPDPLTKLLNETPRGIRCGAGRSTFAILPDGRMCPCSGLDQQTTHPLASGFSQAWKELNEIARNYAIPAECTACFYHDRCLTCAAMHKDAKPGHCNNAICQRTKKLVSAGILPMPHNAMPK